MIKPTKNDIVLTPVYGGELVIAGNFVLQYDTKQLIEKFTDKSWTFIAAIENDHNLANKIMTKTTSVLKHDKGKISLHDTANGVIIFVERRIKNKVKAKILKSINS
mgnify:CR=1 FL=1